MARRAVPLIWARDTMACRTYVISFGASARPEDPSRVHCEYPERDDMVFRAVHDAWLRFLDLGVYSMSMVRIVFLQLSAERAHNVACALNAALRHLMRDFEKCPYSPAHWRSLVPRMVARDLSQALSWDLDIGDEEVEWPADIPLPTFAGLERACSALAHALNMVDQGIYPKCLSDQTAVFLRRLNAAEVSAALLGGDLEVDLAMEEIVATFDQYHPVSAYGAPFSNIFSRTGLRVRHGTLSRLSMTPSDFACLALVPAQKLVMRNVLFTTDTASMLTILLPRAPIHLERCVVEGTGHGTLHSVMERRDFARASLPDAMLCEDVSVPLKNIVQAILDTPRPAPPPRVCTPRPKAPPRPRATKARYASAKNPVPRKRAQSRVQ